MTEKLGLNDKQQAEIYAVNLQEVEKRKVIRDRMKAKLQAEQMARYKTVLTSGQYEKLETEIANREAKRAEHKGKHGHGHHAKPKDAPQGKKGGMHRGHGQAKGKGNPEMKAQKITDRMTEKLGLNEQQQSDILAINMQEVKNRQNIRTKIEQKMRNEQMARYKTILTSEQYATFEKLQAERQAKRAERKGKRG